MLKKNMTIKEFVEEYYSHDARIWNIKHDPIKEILSFKFENFEIVEDKSDDSRVLVQLDVTIDGVQNLRVSSNKTEIINDKVTHPNVEPERLEKMDTSLLGIYLDGNFCVTILTDSWMHKDNVETVIIFVAKSVSIIETKVKLKHWKEYYEKFNKK